jgi:hypothetical protein
MQAKFLQTEEVKTENVSDDTAVVAVVVEARVGEAWTYKRWAGELRVFVGSPERPKDCG